MRRRLDCTQGEWVRRRLLDGRTLVHGDLIRACGGFRGHRLAAYIHKLRRQQGWPVDSTALSGATGPNPPVRYSIPLGWKPGDPVQLGLL